MPRYKYLASTTSTLNALKGDDQHTGKGQDGYRILVDDNEDSEHTTEREDLESDTNRYAEGSEAKVVHDYEAIVDVSRRRFLGATVKCSVASLVLAACGSEGDSPELEQTDPDSVPDQFIFNDQTDVALVTIITSNYITVTGITLSATITIHGNNNAQYQINERNWTNEAGVVVPGDKVRVRHESGAVAGISINTTLIIGGVHETFTSTTTPAASTRDMLVGINGQFWQYFGNEELLANVIPGGAVTTWPSNSLDLFDYPIGSIVGELVIAVRQFYLRGGTWHVRWSGTTTPENVTLAGSTNPIVINSNEKTFDVAENNNGFLALTIGPGGTLLPTNGGLQMFHSDDAHRIDAGQSVSQQYLDAFGGSNHWRAFWATNGSSSSVVNFDEINPTARLSWQFSNLGGSTNPGDIPLEVIAKIANEVSGGNLYYSAPPKGTPDCWRQIFEYFNTALNGKLYLTVGNEVWNTYAEFGDNTAWFELYGVPAVEVTIASTGPAIATDPGHNLSNGDYINLFARQHESYPYVWGGVAGENASDPYSVTNVTADTWQLADHNNIALSNIGVSELYYKKRTGNVPVVRGFNMELLRRNYASALLTAWALADQIMGRSRVVHVADMQFGSPLTLTTMQAVPNFNQEVDYVCGNAYANIFDSTSPSKTDAQIMADAMANMDENTFDTMGYWIVDAYNTLKAASPTAELGTYEGDEGSSHIAGGDPATMNTFIAAWKKRDTGGGTFAPWYWQKLADLNIKFHTHFADSGNWGIDGGPVNVAGIRRNGGDNVNNNAYFREWRTMIDAGGVNKF